MYKQGSFHFEEDRSTNDIRQSLPKEARDKVLQLFAEVLYKQIVERQKGVKNEPKYEQN